MNKLNIYVSNHKTGSVLIFNILDEFCKKKKLIFNHDLNNEVNYNCDIFFHWNSCNLEKKLKNIKKKYKLIYSKRHPYSIINSCYHYHKNMKNNKEKWCFDKIKEINNSYNNYLNEITFRKGIEFEMTNNFAKESAFNIIKRLERLSQLKNKNIISIKFEEFIFNFRKNIYLIFTHFDLKSYSTFFEFLYIANNHNINNNNFKKFKYTSNHILKYDRTHKFMNNNLRRLFYKTFTKKIFNLLNYKENENYSYSLYNSKSILDLENKIYKLINFKEKIINFNKNNIFYNNNLAVRSFFCNLEEIRNNEYLLSERIIVKNNSKSNIRNWNGKYCFTLIRKIKFYNNFKNFKINKQFILKNNFSDSRIIKFKKNFYFLGVVCKNKNINLCLYKLCNNELELIFIFNEVTNCKREKNWSHFIYNNKLYFQYGFHPFVIIRFKIEILNKNIDFIKKKFSRNSYENPLFIKNNIYDNLNIKINYFEEIYKKYNKNIIFSPTTKLLKFKKSIFVGIGHLKVKYENYNKENFVKFLNEIKNKYNLDDNIKNWYNLYENLIHKNKYIYFIFYYSINMQNFEIKFSNFFIPKTKDKTTVVFPSTFIKFNNKYLIIYSVNDTYSEKIYIKKKEIENKLIYNTETNFENVKFILEQ